MVLIPTTSFQGSSTPKSMLYSLSTLFKSLYYNTWSYKDSYNIRLHKVTDIIIYITAIQSENGFTLQCFSYRNTHYSMFLPFYTPLFSLTFRGTVIIIAIIIITLYYQPQPTTFCSHSILWIPKIVYIFLLLICSNVLILLNHLSFLSIKNSTPEYFIKGVRHSWLFIFCNKYLSTYYLLETKNKKQDRTYLSKSLQPTTKR